jgi:hypothetical protein
MSEKQISNAPLAKEGDIAVFLRRTVSVQGVDVPIYNVSVGKQGARSYVEVYGNVAGRRLEPEMILELMKGEAIEVDFPSRSGQNYVGSLVNGGLKTETFNDRTTTKLNMVKIGHLIDRNGEQFGYKVPTVEGGHIEFYKHIRSGQFPNAPVIELDARDCYALVLGGAGTEIKKELGTVKLTGTSDKTIGEKTYTRASLAVRYTNEIDQKLKEENSQQRRQRSDPEQQQGSAEERTITP